MSHVRPRPQKICRYDFDGTIETLAEIAAWIRDNSEHDCEVITSDNLADRVRVGAIVAFDDDADAAKFQLRFAAEIEAHAAHIAQWERQIAAHTNAMIAAQTVSMASINAAVALLAASTGTVEDEGDDA